MKKMKNDNKGFTLVELIVVLVILAILAAILVPALLGYIDEAKNKNLELHGKSVYTSAQAVASKMYAKDAKPYDTAEKSWTDSQTAAAYFIQEVRKISEMADFNNDATKVKAVIEFGKITTGTETTAKHNDFTVKSVAYTEDGGTTWTKLEGGTWTLQPSGTDFPTATETGVLVTGKDAAAAPAAGGSTP